MANSANTTSETDAGALRVNGIKEKPGNHYMKKTENDLCNARQPYAAARCTLSVGTNRDPMDRPEKDGPLLTVAEVLHIVQARIVTTSIGSDGHWPVPVSENAAGREPGVSVEANPGGTKRPLGNILGLLDDAALLLLVVLLFPLVILLVGMPVALFVRLLVEIAQRL